ncbi:Bov2 [Bovine gammaherpesvirus 6]|uniref:Bov2 n=1 Tax=Bovine gammaherpesvirus 6 TaxID=1504288 RepID=A0A060CXY7_9GAMA|nr:Bov2 [Bovine gammaherpesvirus 6]AIB03156.1 Bov2 [Bovine gammaherpesvirus 6]
MSLQESTEEGQIAVKEEQQAAALAEDPEKKQKRKRKRICEETEERQAIIRARNKNASIKWREKNKQIVETVTRVSRKKPFIAWGS